MHSYDFGPGISRGLEWSEIRTKTPHKCALGNHWFWATTGYWRWAWDAYYDPQLEWACEACRAMEALANVGNSGSDMRVTRDYSSLGIWALLEKAIQGNSSGAGAGGADNRICSGMANPLDLGD